VTIIPDFLYHALLAGLIVAIIAGPLGCFVLWQRLAYFGDTLAHSALLGIVLGLWFSIAPLIAVVICCVGLALLLVWLQRKPQLATDSLLGILAHGSLAIGLVAIALMDNMRLNLHAYLFGDLLAVSRQDVVAIAATVAVLSLVLVRYWNALVAVTTHAQLAQVEGLAVQRLRLLLMIMMALLVAIAMKIVGILLVTALLIIPAASARALARSPEQMAILAAVAGCVAVVGGLVLSILYDTPAGPSVVVVALGLFVVSLLCPRTG
jgi:zinc transport system permease protein